MNFMEWNSRVTCNKWYYSHSLRCFVELQVLCTWMIEEVYLLMDTKIYNLNDNLSWETSLTNFTLITNFAKNICQDHMIIIWHGDSSNSITCSYVSENFTRQWYHMQIAAEYLGLWTFAPKSSYGEIFFISRLELFDQVLTPKMKKKMGVTDFVSEKMAVEKCLNFKKSVIITRLVFSANTSKILKITR